MNFKELKYEALRKAKIENYSYSKLEAFVKANAQSELQAEIILTKVYNYMFHLSS